MIRIVLAREPKSFDDKVRSPGLRAIAEMVGEIPVRESGKRFSVKANNRADLKSGDFPAYWTEALDDLMTEYNHICAYSCFRIHPVTGGRSVDHMAPKSLAWDSVYEWSNYRLACSLVNSRKNIFDDVLDPCDIRDGWFELELVGFQVVPNSKLDVDDPLRIQIQNTIDRLGLKDFCKERERDAENYWSRDVRLRVLTEESPFVAMELRRQGRLHPEDI